MRKAAQEAYDEGYERGIHDHDTTVILNALLPLYQQAGPLRHEPAARATAQLFWAHGTTPEARKTWARRAVSLARARETFGPAATLAELEGELAETIGAWSRTEGIGAAAYLVEELTCGTEGFVLSTSTRELLDTFHHTTVTSGYEEDMAALDDFAARRQLTEAWLSSYASSTGRDLTTGDLAEAVAAKLCPDLPRYESHAPLTATADGLLGTHPRITRSLTLRIDEFLTRTRKFAELEVPPSAPTSAAAPPWWPPNAPVCVWTTTAADHVRLRPQPAHRRGVPAAHR